MKKMLTIIVTVVVLLTAGLSGCNQIKNVLNGDKGKFVGTWKSQNNTITADGIIIPNIDFFSNGTYSIIYPIMSQTGTWDLKDGKLVLTFGGGGSGLTCSYRLSNNDRTPTLTSTLGGPPEALIKQ